MVSFQDFVIVAAFGGIFAFRDLVSFLYTLVAFVATHSFNIMFAIVSKSMSKGIIVEYN